MKVVVFIIFLHIMNEFDNNQENPLLVDMSDMDEVRKAIIANEILNRKYE